MGQGGAHRNSSGLTLPQHGTRWVGVRCHGQTGRCLLSSAMFWVEQRLDLMGLHSQAILCRRTGGVKAILRITCAGIYATAVFVSTEGRRAPPPSNNFAVRWAGMNMNASFAVRTDACARACDAVVHSTCLKKLHLPFVVWVDRDEPWFDCWVLNNLFSAVLFSPSTLTNAVRRSTRNRSRQDERALWCFWRTINLP